MLDAAVSLGQSVNYRSAGTVEYIYDADRDEFYFLEVNTRLQVEHPVTESVTGLDLIEWMLKIAAGESPDLASFEPTLNGASMEVRIYAEDPLKDFQPSPGELTDVYWPEDGVRVDTWVENGSEVSAHYDPMIAKLIVHGTNRADALAKLRQALAETRLMGIATNLDYLRQVVAQQSFEDGIVSTRALESFEFKPSVAEVLKPGTYTTVQDYPGRVGYWNIGVPPSGPMDDYAFRIANRIVGNHNDAAGLESTLIGPSLKFHKDSVVALTGALTDATLTAKRWNSGNPLPSKPARYWPWARPSKVAVPIWRYAAVLMCRCTWAAALPSPGPVWRPRRPAPAPRRHARHQPAGAARLHHPGANPRPRPGRPGPDSGLPQPLGNRRALWPPRRPGFLLGKIH